MLISFDWLSELLPLAEGAHEIARRLTSRGLTVDASTEIDGDTVFDIDVPANRPDALGHRGVAREVAAAFGTALRASPPPPPPSGRPVADEIALSIEAPDLCGRYTAGIVRGVRVGPSPASVVRRLEACGLRSINNVVDVSNIVMLELGQPIHVFDLSSIRGHAVRVRRAERGESITTLDGVERSLDGEMLVIADAERGVALGGVIGGAETEITDATQDVLIEAAWFLPRSVRRTARALGLSTDASQRFERGCDPEAPSLAQALAARLLVDLAGGTAAPGTLDARPRPPSAPGLSVRLTRAARLLGYAPGAEEALTALAAVGLSPRRDGDVIHVAIPSWRVDLDREADLVEEIGRHLGYDRIPSRRPAAAPRLAVGGSTEVEDRVRDRLASLGFCEALTYAMVGVDDDAPFVAASAPSSIPLLNPIAEPLAVLRRTLLPGLLRAADQNLRRGAADVRLFEVGSVFLARAPGELPNEPLRVAFAWSGAAVPAHWSAPAREADVFDAAGIVEDLLSLAAGGARFQKRPSDLAGLHPGRSVAWLDDTMRPVAWCGPVHPEIAARLDLPAAVLLGEIDLGLALGARAPAAAFRATPRVPPVVRDLSIVLEPGAEAGAVVAAFDRVVAPAPVSFVWLDRYAGPPLSPGQVAMTLRVILQPFDRTLNDAEAEAFRARLLEVLDGIPGARLRRIDT